MGINSSRRREEKYNDLDKGSSMRKKGKIKQRKSENEWRKPVQVLCIFVEDVPLNQFSLTSKRVTF